MDQQIEKQINNIEEEKQKIEIIRQDITELNTQKQQSDVVKDKDPQIIQIKDGSPQLTKSYSQNKLELKMMPTEIIQPFEENSSLKLNKSVDDLKQNETSLIALNRDQELDKIQELNQRQILDSPNERKFKQPSPSKEIFRKLKKIADGKQSPLKTQKQNLPQSIKKVKLKKDFKNSRNDYIIKSTQQSSSPSNKLKLKEQNHQNSNSKEAQPTNLEQSIFNLDSSLRESLQRTQVQTSRQDSQNEYASDNYPNYDNSTSNQIQNQSFSIQSSTSRNLLSKLKNPKYQMASLNNQKQVKQVFDSYNEEIFKTFSINYQTLDRSSRKQSQSVEPAAKQASLKIQKILDDQKALRNNSLVKIVSNMETKLFHNISSNKQQQRSKSVLKNEVALPYKSKRKLPQISFRLNNSSLGGSLLGETLNHESSNDIQDPAHFKPNSQMEVLVSDSEDIFQKSSLHKYLQEARDSTQIASKTQINSTNKTLDSSLQATPPDYTTSNINFDDQEFKQKIKDLQLDTFENKNLSLQLTDQNTMAMVSVVNLMMKHQVFKKMQKSSVKKLISNICTLTLLKKGQVLYKQEDESKDLYIVIYGSLSIWNKRSGNLGRVAVGFTAGEESLLDQKYVCRLDNCFAEVESCVFIVQRDQYLNFKRSIDSRDSVLLKDVGVLDMLFNRNYIMKQGWKSGGISKLIQNRKGNKSELSRFFTLNNSKID